MKIKSIDAIGAAIIVLIAGVLLLLLCAGMVVHQEIENEKVNLAVEDSEK